MRNIKFIKEIKPQIASNQSEEVAGQELNPSVDHKTSGQRQTLKSADQTGEMLEKPPGHGGAASSTGTEKKGNQLGTRAPGGGQDSPASGEQEKWFYAEVTRGGYNKGPGK